MILKTNKEENKICSWVLENITECKTFCNPYFGDGSVFFSKKFNDEEIIISDEDIKIISVLRVLRDEKNDFIKKLKSFKPSKKLFDFHEDVVKHKEDINSYFEFAFSSLVVLTLANEKEQNYKTVFDKTIVKLEKISSKIENTTILNDKAELIIDAWDDVDNFIFMNLFNSEIKRKKDFVKSLKNLRSKVLFVAKNNTFYNKYFKEWKKVYHKDFGIRKKDVICLFKNF